jgi:hypothetical protein
VLGDDVTIGDEIYVNGGSVLPHKSIKQNVDGECTLWFIRSIANVLYSSRYHNVSSSMEEGVIDIHRLSTRIFTLICMHNHCVWRHGTDTYSTRELHWKV